MKKWMAVYLAIAAVIFGCCIGIQTNQLRQSGTFSHVVEGEEKFAQAAEGGKRTDIIIWGSGKETSVRVDGRQRKFKLLDLVMVKDKEIYYQYQFEDRKGNRFYGLGLVNIGKRKNQKLEVWSMSGEKWLAFGTDKKESQLIYETTSAREGEIVEYRKALPWQEKAEWKGVEKTESLAAISTKTTQKKESLFERGKAPWLKICIRNAVFSVIPGYFILALLIALFINGIFGEYSAIVRMISGLQVILLVFAMALFFFGSFCSVRQMIDQQNEVIKTNIAYILKELPDDGDVPEDLLGEMQNMNADMVAEVASVRLSDKGLIVTDSSVGIKEDQGYTKSILELVEKAKKNRGSVDGRIAYKDSRTEGIVVVDLYHAQQKNMILVIYEPTYLSRLIRGNMMEYGRYLLVIYILATILLTGIGILYELRWREFTRTSKKLMLSPGEVSLEDVSERHFAGFEILWQLILQMYGTMKESIYQMQKGLRFGYRFVPGGLDRLFRKEELSDLLVGENETMRGDMAWLTMGSIKHLDEAQYMEELSWIFEIVSKAQEERDGAWIHYDAELDKNKIFFEEEEDALEFAVQVIGKMDENPELADVSKLVLIHQDQYHFGIAGSEEKVFPYAYTQMDDFLDEFLEHLRSAGVRVAVTENVYEQNKDLYTMRYIGFFNNAQHDGRIRLYECLDAYSGEKRKLYIAARASFERALKFFYSNDFYLARNLFNEVIQINPADEIARSYLFKCEYYLNHDRTEEFSYGLFEQ